MYLKVNGKETQIAGGITVAMLLAEKGLNPATVVVEYNHAIVGQDEWRNIILKSGDCLEIVSFVGGG